MLITGLHTVADIFCSVCNSNLGWKYVSAPPPTALGVAPVAAADSSGCTHMQEMAFEATQKYKEGKYIIEKARVVKVRP
jgi:hypothetical protein